MRGPLTVAVNHMNKGANPKINFGDSLSLTSLKMRERLN